MPKAILVNMAGTQVGEVELSEAVFGIEPNQTVVHEAPRSPAAALSPGARRAPAAPVRAAPAPPSGPTAASCSPPSPATTATC